MIFYLVQVADQSSIPVILYSVPGNTSIDMSPDVVIKLSGHPNIIGLKDSAGDVRIAKNFSMKIHASNTLY